MTDHPDPSRRWRNRRRMAWLCCAASLLYPVAVWLSGAPHLADMAGHFYLFTGAVVGAYIGFATWEDKR